MLPFRNGSSVSIPLRSGSRIEVLPGAVAAYLEAQGFFVSELNERGLSFLGPNPGNVMRWPGSSLNQLSGGSVLVRPEEGGARVDFQLSFTHYVVLAFGVSAFLGVVFSLTSDSPLWLTIPGWAAFFAYLVLANAWLTTRAFGRRLRRYLLENSVRYV